MIRCSFHGLGSPRLVLTANPSHSQQWGIWRVPGKVGEGAAETRFSQEDDGTAHGGHPLETAPMWPADNTGAQGDCDARWPRAARQQGGLWPPVRSLQLGIPPGGRDPGAPMRGGPGTSGAGGQRRGHRQTRSWGRTSRAGGDGERVLVSETGTVHQDDNLGHLRAAGTVPRAPSWPTGVPGPPHTQHRGDAGLGPALAHRLHDLGGKLNSPSPGVSSERLG